MMIKIAIAALMIGTGMAPVAHAQAKPPQITWDWYGAGETYRRYEDGKSPRDNAIAVQYFRKAAEKGNDSAAYKLGESYEEGIGVPKNARMAYRWYRQAADAGNKWAEYKVGWAFQHGEGVRKNSSEAAKWYQRSASKGNEWSQHMLGFMLADGEGVRRDRGTAIRYLEMANPKTGDHWGKWKLATLIQTTEPARARSLLREAAAQGNPEARKVVRGLAR